jgi:hypothetical protein
MASVSSFYSTPRRMRFSQAAIVVGTGALVVGLWQRPQQTWATFLLVNLYLIGLGVGGLAWLSLHYLTGARWSEAVKGISQAMSMVLPVAAIGLLSILLCRPSLYSWTSAEFASEPVSPLRHLWLSRPFFLSRALIYLGAWVAFAAAFLKVSRQEALGAEAAAVCRRGGLAGAFLVVFGVTCWLASHDWIMSLEPDWTSTIFSVYNFAGLFLSSLAATTLLIVWLGSRGESHSRVTKSQLHDLGTLLFALSSFWMYLWFCQYWLIWYVNNPEETAYFVRRSQGDWPLLTLVSLACNWGVPFVILLFRWTKRSPRVLVIVAVVVLIGRWLDLTLMIFPSQASTIPKFGIIEGGLLVGAAGIFLTTVLLTLGNRPAAHADVQHGSALPGR